MIEFSKKQKDVDSFFRETKKNISLDLPLARFVLKHKNSSVLFSRFGCREKFLTGSSGAYAFSGKLRPQYSSRRSYLIDSVFSPGASPVLSRKRKLVYTQDRTDRIYRDIKDRYQTLGNYFSGLFRGAFEGASTARMWNVSIVSSLIFGMFLMTMIYRYLGQGVLAKPNDAPVARITPQVLAAESAQDDSQSSAEQVTQQILKQEMDQEAKEGELDQEIRQMVKGYPIEKMIPYISKKDRTVAAFMIGIAKQESDWGVHVPVDKDGNDCYNYWGFRGKNPVGTGGHSCFSSPQDAVDTVAKRLEFLVSSEKINTPNKMVVVWKCGYDCSWDKPGNVANWIEAVDLYFGKLNSG